MKKLVSLGLTIIILGIGFLILKTYVNSLEEVLDIDSHFTYEILHIENLGSHSIVFSKVEDDYLHVALLKKSLLSYKLVHSSVQSDLKRTLDEMKYLYFEYPGIKTDETTFYVGAIDLNQTDSITLRYDSEKTIENAKVIRKEEIGLWIASKEINNNSEITIILSSERNGEITTEEFILLNFN